MTESILTKLFEHNNWANLQVIRACAGLSEAQLDAEPQSATRGNIRQTLLHLARAQAGYLQLLTLPAEERKTATPSYADLEKAVGYSGEGLLALAADDSGDLLKTRLQTKDGYTVEAWVVMVQAINHATEHREQVKSMLSALGATPPDIDGWDFGAATQALFLNQT